MTRCQNKAMFRYTWPGKDEDFVCWEHAEKLWAVAHALGFHLQLIPLSAEEQSAVSCSQKTT